MDMCGINEKGDDEHRRTSNCYLFNEKLCKCDTSSFRMMCDAEYANTEQSLVRLFDFRLPEIFQPRQNFKLSLNRLELKGKLIKIFIQYSFEKG